MARFSQRLSLEALEGRFLLSGSGELPTTQTDSVAEVSDTPNEDPEPLPTDPDGDPIPEPAPEPIPEPGGPA